MSQDNQQQAQSGGLGTSLGVAGLSKKSGAASLVYTRVSSTGEQVDVDLWNTAMDNMSASNLSRILEASKVDQTYSLESFIRGIEYQGFDRDFYIKHALSKMSVSVFCRFAVLGAIRGSNFQKINDTCEHMPADLSASYNSLSFVKTPKKRTDLTILRNTASIPHWCAYYIMKANVSRKIDTHPCPAELQFPGAASLPMSRDLRLQHIDFCIKFSALLPGGKFNSNIYMTAYSNMISFSEIPSEVLSILGVASISDARAVTATEITDMVSRSVVKV